MVDSLNDSRRTQLTHEAVSRTRCRQIGENDLEGLIGLTKAYPKRTRRNWTHAMQQLAMRETPAAPRFGYLLEQDGMHVGIILLIFSTLNAHGKAHVKCNVSTWFVDPCHRAYGSLLIASAI